MRRFSPQNVLAVALAALTFAVIALVLTTQVPEAQLVDVNLPVMSAIPAAPLHTGFVVTVTKTEPGHRGRGEFASQTLGTGDCLVYLHDNRAVGSAELYESAFDWLDDYVTSHYSPLIDHHPTRPIRPPPFQIRADAGTPWRCIAGVIFAAQISGYPSVSLLTNPVRP